MVATISTCPSSFVSSSFLSGKNYYLDALQRLHRTIRIIGAMNDARIVPLPKVVRRVTKSGCGALYFRTYIHHEGDEPNYDDVARL